MFSLDAGAVNDNNLLCKSGLASMIPDVLTIALTIKWKSQHAH